MIGMYLVVILGVALWVARRWIGDESDFMIAGREMGTTLTAASLVAILLSGGFVPTIVLFGFIAGIGGGWFFWAWSLGLLLVQLTWLGYWRYTGGYTPAEFFEYQYGVSGRLATLFAVLIFGLIAGSFQYLGAGSIIAGVLEIPVSTAIIGVGVTITVYAMVAGIWGISITDFIQAVWVLAAVFVILPIFLWSNHGPPTVGGGITAEMMSFPFGGMNVLSLAGGTVLTFIVLQFMLANAAHYWIRASTARNQRTVRNGWIVSIVVVVIMGFIGAYLGLWAKMLVPDAQPNLAFGTMLAQETPIWLGALSISGIVAATMSTADMMYQVVANTMTRDVFQRFMNITEHDRLLKLSRVTIMAAGIVTIGIAVIWPQSLPDIISFAFTMCVPLFILSFDSWTFNFGTKEGASLMVLAAFLGAIYWVIVAPPIASEVNVIWVSTVLSPLTFYIVSGLVHMTGSWWDEPASLSKVENRQPMRTIEISQIANISDIQRSILDAVNRNYTWAADVLDYCGPRLNEQERGMDSAAYLREIDRLIEDGYLRRESERFNDHLKLRLTEKGREAAPTLSEAHHELLESHGITLDALSLLSDVVDHADREGDVPTISELQDSGAMDLATYQYTLLFNSLVDAGLATEKGVFRYRIDPTDAGRDLVSQYADEL